MPFFFLSCLTEEALTEEKVKVLFSVDDFETICDSRTTINPNAGYSITWASGDVIGIFPREGYQEPFSIPADQVGKANATFDGGYWALKNGFTYNAYYPFDKANFESADMKTMISVSYVGQEQTGKVCNAGAFDYTYSDWNKAVNGSVSFRFHHIGAIAVFHLEYPATTTYTRMTLSANEAVIPTTGTYDLTADNVAFIANENEKVQSISLALKNHIGTVGETGVFYMMLPPMNLSQNELIVSLTASDGTICTYSLESQNFVKAKKYELTGKPIKSDVEGSVDGWGEEVKDDTPYLTFKADAEQIFFMTKAVETLEYSVNGGEWTELGTNTVLFGGDSGDLRLRGKSTMGTATGYRGSSQYSSIKFLNSTSVNCFGDIRTLIDFENHKTVDTSLAKFCYLFKDNKRLKTAPELLATTLAEDCYAYMFYNCSNLAIAPALPASILTNGCYRGMFQGCTSLIFAPELSSMGLADGCYASMFSKCTSLTKAPQLPAQTLVTDCYASMFANCTKLTSAPKLPVMYLAEYCYSGMFQGCTSLAIAPELPATSLAKDCYSYMFEGCTNLMEAPKLPATILAEGCYTRMFRDCISLTMAPELPAATLIKYCYCGMFYGCTNLTSIIMLAENMKHPDYLYEENLENCLIDWVVGVASSGTFTKASSATLPTSNHGIPNGWIVVNYDKPNDNDNPNNEGPSPEVGNFGVEEF